MIINFKRIKFSNFFSFKYADIDLTNRGYTIVKGINNNPINSIIKKTHDKLPL